MMGHGSGRGSVERIGCLLLPSCKQSLGRGEGRKAEGEGRPWVQCRFVCLPVLIASAHLAVVDSSVERVMS